MFKRGDKIVYTDDQKFRFLELNKIYTVFSIGLYTNGDFYVILDEINKYERYLGYPSMFFESLSDIRKQKLKNINENR